MIHIREHLDGILETYRLFLERDDLLEKERDCVESLMMATMDIAHRHGQQTFYYNRWYVRYTDAKELIFRKGLEGMMDS